MTAPPFTITDRNASGKIIRTERVRWIPLKDIRPLNLVQIRKVQA